MGRQLVDGIDQFGDVGWRSGRQDAVAKVENVTRSAIGLIQNGLDMAADLVGRCV